MTARPQPKQTSPSARRPSAEEMKETKETRAEPEPGEEARPYDDEESAAAEQRPPADS